MELTSAATTGAAIDGRGALRSIVAALAFGLGLGLAADLLTRLRHGAGGLARRSALPSFLEALLLVAGLHAAVVGWSMADTPWVYAGRWYDVGAGPRTAQVIVTDGLGPAGVVGVSLVFAIVYVKPARLVSALWEGRRSLRRWRERTFSLSLVTGVPLVTTLTIGATTLAVGGAIFVFTHIGSARADASGGASRDAALEARSSLGVVRDSSIEPRPNAPPRAPGARPNVLVLGVGAFRADHLDPRFAPNLTELAARGARFDRAYVSSPQTLPSWVTTLTGRFPHRHGLRFMFPTAEQRGASVDALPARFAQAGYETAAFGDHAAEVFSRVDLGFLRVLAPSADLRRSTEAFAWPTPILPVIQSRFGRWAFSETRARSVVSDPRLLAEEIATVIREKREAPFFVTAFFSTTHFPYAAAAPYYGMFTDRAYRGRFKYHASFGANEIPLDAADVRQLEQLHAGSMASVDAAVGRILSALRRANIQDRTIVVITADRGHAPFETASAGPRAARLLADDETHVPLVVFDPRFDRGSGVRTDSVVRDVDVAPTLYELAGIEPPSDLDGESLVPSLRGEAIEPRLAFAESGLDDTSFGSVRASLDVDAATGEIVLCEDEKTRGLVGKQRMVRDARFKLVYVPERASVRYELFDTAADPAETRDVAEKHPLELARLRVELHTWMLKDRAIDMRGGYVVPRGAR